MNPETNLARAIGSEFVGRKLKSIAIAMVFVGILVLAGAIWLTTISSWWWLLAVPVIMFTFLGIMAYLVARVIIKRLRPRLTKPQAKGVSGFVDKLERVADNLQTPMFIIVFRVLRDIVSRRDQIFIQTVAQDSTTLRKDLQKLRQNFK